MRARLDSATLAGSDAGRAPRLTAAGLAETARCFGPNNGATWDCRSRFRLEPNSADPSRSVPRAANPPCHHQKCARPRLRPLDLMGPGNGILQAETGGRLQAQNAGEWPEFGSQT